MLTDRFVKSKWGVMCHLLDRIQNNPEIEFSSEGKKTSWNELIAQFDVENFAAQLYEMQAKYLLITIMQGSKYMIAPNKTYDEIICAKPGEACSERDLVLDLYDVLKKYDIDLYLYYTGDGPYQDEIAGPKMGFHKRFEERPVPGKFIENWSSVLKEYAWRYRGKVKGWWIDGCYDEAFGYTEEKLRVYHTILKEADENYLVTYNDGFACNQAFKHEPNLRLGKYMPFEDYTAGEALDFNIYPPSRFIDGAQWHILSPLSGDDTQWNCGWGGTGIKYSEEEFAEYLKKVWAQGGVVSVDMALSRSGNFHETQKTFMKNVMKKVK